MASANLVFERRGKGPPLLLLHGLGSSLRMCDPVRPLLEPHLDVIALDLPGHGASPVSMPAASSMRAPALEVAACLDRLEIPTAHMAGNSLGGWLALELAKMGRAQSVTALSPAGLWRGNTPAYNVVLFHVFRTIARWLGSVFSRLAGNPVTRTILFWQFFGRPWAIPKAAAIEAANACKCCVLTPSSRRSFPRREHNGSRFDRLGARDVFLCRRNRDSGRTSSRTQRSKLDRAAMSRFDDRMRSRVSFSARRPWTLDEQRRDKVATWESLTQNGRGQSAAVPMDRRYRYLFRTHRALMATVRDTPVLFTEEGRQGPALQADANEDVSRRHRRTASARLHQRR